MKKAILPLLLIISLATIEAAGDTKKLDKKPQSNTMGVKNGWQFVDPMKS